MTAAELRAANADRERVVSRLIRAQEQGRIDVFEFDERLAAAYAARTYGELDALTVDLPAEAPEAGPAGPAGGVPTGVPTGGPRLPGRRGRGYLLALRIEGAAWLFASVINLMIWAIVSVAGAHAAYPWWIWVAGPWGLVLLARVLVGVPHGCVRTRF
jgi:hypothetical protein